MNISPKARISINRVIEKFTTGNLSPITHIAKIQLDSSIPASSWSMSNKLLVYLQSGELDCRGYQQWKSAGRQVKKGSEAVYIISPRMVKVRKEGIPADHPDRTEMKLVGYLCIPVFSASNTDGEKLESIYTPKEFPPLFDVASKLGVSVKYLPTPDDRLGDCNQIGTVIRLGSYSFPVFFHELAHAIHAKIEGPLTKKNNTKQEIIAEFIAAVLMDFYGYDYSGNAWGYISKFSTDPLIAIMSAMKTVEKVLEVIEKTDQETSA